MSNLSDMLVYLRKRKGLSQQELAEKTGLTRSAIGMYETGKRNPDLETLEMFADFYNVDMNTLTGGTKAFKAYDDTSLKFALWGDADEITDADLEDVRRYAEFIKERKKHNGND